MGWELHGQLPADGANDSTVRTQANRHQPGGFHQRGHPMNPLSTACSLPSEAVRSWVFA